MRTGISQKGQFNVKPGMTFVMPGLRNKIKDREDRYIDAGKHPWLVLSVSDDYVEMVMCTTLSSEYEHKHRLDNLDYPNITDIVNSCPPMDPMSERVSGVSMDTYKYFPKKELFSHNLYLLNRNTPKRNFQTEGIESLRLDSATLKNIRKEVRNYALTISSEDNDPFHCYEQEGYLENLESGEPVPEWFTKESYERQFGWRHLKNADPLAVYPRENEMAPYEKQDRGLVEIVRKHDGQLDDTDDFTQAVNSISNNTKAINK